MTRQQPAIDQLRTIEEAFTPHGPNGCSNPELCVALTKLRLAIEAEAAVRAALADPVAKSGLDVERLAQAIENHLNHRLSTHVGGGWCDMPECAPDIAAEYARLAAAEQEQQP